MLVTYRPDLTPALRRLFAHRVTEVLSEVDALIHESLGLPPPEPLEPTSSARSKRPAERGYRVKVSLQWDPHIWRIVEILDNQSLEDLHYAIQDAFGWDDDHLYAFFLSGRAWDRLTEVPRPFEEQMESPTADEVTLADAELRPGQKLLYIFDFGDELTHQIQVLDVFPAPAPHETRTFPRIVESHGEAPPQYPTWDDQEDTW
jgi:hypothetical protein